MRYGNPSLRTAVEAIQRDDCLRLVIIPLFPQYASAASGSAIAAALDAIGDLNNHPSIHVVRDFYNHPGFIRAWVEQIQAVLAAEKPWDQLLLSYHGLPVRHLTHSGCRGCLPATRRVCPTASDNTNDTLNATCYRAQCYTTARLIAAGLALNTDQYTVCFQSRLGKTPWIQPYTDEMLVTLASQGAKRVVIACPAFVADCLETLEEIGIRASAQWRALGGECCTLVPCLNAHPTWVNTLVQLVNC